MSSEPEKQAKPVSLSKGPAHADEPAAAERPRTVVAAAAALGGSALLAIGAAIVLYGQRSWLTTETIKGNKDNIKNAISDAVSSASSAHSDVPSASSSASVSAAKDWPTTPAGVHHSVSQQQTSALIISLVFAAAVAFIASGIYRGRHWGRWSTIVFWLLASLSTPFGVGGLFLIGGSAPAAYRVLGFAAAVLLAAAVVFANLRPSVAYFALSRPAPREGVPARRGLFAPRPPADEPARKVSAVGKAKTALTSSARDRGETYVQKQRAKNRAAAHRESVARGAELARSRAKASKSRRIETDRRR